MPRGVGVRVPLSAQKATVIWQSLFCVQRDSHWLWRLGRLVCGDWLCELLCNYEYRVSVSRSSKLGTNTHPIFYTYGILPNQFTLVCSRSADRSSSLGGTTLIVGWLYLQTLQNVDLSSYKNFLIALYFFAIKNRVRAHQHKIFLLTFAVELEWWC